MSKCPFCTRSEACSCDLAKSLEAAFLRKRLDDLEARTARLEAVANRVERAFQRLERLAEASQPEKYGDG